MTCERCVASRARLLKFAGKNDGTYRVGRRILLALRHFHWA